MFPSTSAHLIMCGSDSTMPYIYYSPMCSTRKYDNCVAPTQIYFTKPVVTLSLTHSLARSFSAYLRIYLYMLCYALHLYARTSTNTHTNMAYKVSL